MPTVCSPLPPLCRAQKQPLMIHERSPGLLPRHRPLPPFASSSPFSPFLPTPGSGAVTAETKIPGHAVFRRARPLVVASVLALRGYAHEVVEGCVGSSLAFLGLVIRRAGLRRALGWTHEAPSVDALHFAWDVPPTRRPQLSCTGLSPPFLVLPPRVRPLPQHKLRFICDLFTQSTNAFIV